MVSEHEAGLGTLWAWGELEKQAACGGQTPAWPFPPLMASWVRKGHPRGPSRKLKSLREGTVGLSRGCGPRGRKDERRRDLF